MASHWMSARVNGRCCNISCCMPQKTCEQGKLLQSLTGWDKEITPNAVEVYVSRLRAKLEPYGIALRSIRGFGYRIEQRCS